LTKSLKSGVDQRLCPGKKPKGEEKRIEKEGDHACGKKGRIAKQGSNEPDATGKVSPAGCSLCLRGTKLGRKRRVKMERRGGEEETQVYWSILNSCWRKKKIARAIAEGDIEEGKKER